MAKGQSEENRNRDLEIGNRFSELTGYPLILTENSTGGYKDWVIQKTTVPSFTFEVGDETLPHPLGIETLPEIYDKDLFQVKCNDLYNHFYDNYNNAKDNIYNVA